MAWPTPYASTCRTFWGTILIFSFSLPPPPFCSLAAFFAVLVVVGCVACLMPSIYWFVAKQNMDTKTRGKEGTLEFVILLPLFLTSVPPSEPVGHSRAKGDLTIANITETKVEVSLWKTCNTTGSESVCSDLAKFSVDDYKTEKTAERDGKRTKWLSGREEEGGTKSNEPEKKEQLKSVVACLRDREGLCNEVQHR